MSKTFVTSDTHFNHESIIRHCQRPYRDVTEMNEDMIAEWNSVVGPNDTVWHLGDFAYPWKTEGHISFDELGDRLNGTKHLIIGNHDKETMKGGGTKAKDHPMWTSAMPYEELKFGKSRFVLCHYPLETWRNAHHGWFHLHGHCHGSLKRLIPHRLDVGVDTRDSFAPYNLEELRDFFDAQEDYNPQDHHGD